jgi:transposase
VDPTRPKDGHRRRPIAHLEGFKGILQVDGYAGYRKLSDRGDVRLAFCWSHVRRNFYELATPGPAPIASEALDRTAVLYAVAGNVNPYTGVVGTRTPRY